MKMTNEQIDELNELLVDHSEVLTAFYDEGIRYGLKRGATLVIAGAALAALVSCGIEVIKTRRRKAKEIESYNKGSFFLPEYHRGCFYYHLFLT